MNNTERISTMTSKHKLLAIALLVIVLPFLIWVALRLSNSSYSNVDAVITIDTVKPIHFIDTDGRDVGSIGEFEGEVTVTIRRATK